MPGHHIVNPKFSEETPPTHCPIESCRMPVEDAYHLWEHLPDHKLELKQNDRMILCPFKSAGCQTYMAQWGNLEAHYNRHLNVQPHQCPFRDCDRAFADPASRSRHLMNVHGRKPRPRKKPRRRTGTRSRAKALMNMHAEEGEHDADSVVMDGDSDEDRDSARETDEDDDGVDKQKVKEEAFKALRAMFDMVAQPASPSRRRTRLQNVEARNIQHGKNPEQHPARSRVHPIAPAYQDPGRPYSRTHPQHAHLATTVVDENWQWRGPVGPPPAVAPVTHYGWMMPSQRQNVHPWPGVYPAVAYPPSLWPEQNHNAPQNAIPNEYLTNALYNPVQPNADVSNHRAAADLSNVYAVPQPLNHQFNNSQLAPQFLESCYVDYDPSSFAPAAARPAMPYFEDPSDWQ